jgi:endonuclease/exonuclease/phosphatase family metal-dependent hydrolase
MRLLMRLPKPTACATAAALLVFAAGCDQPQARHNRPPTVVITAGPSGTSVADSACFEWQGEDPDGNLAGYYYGLDDSTPETWTESSAVTLRVIGLGRHVFYAQAVDDSGARSVSAARAFERAYQGGVPPAGTDTTIEIATWNLQNFPKKGEQTIGSLLGLIPQLDLDIYAIQEVEDTASFRLMLSALTGFDGVYSADVYGGNSYQKTAIIHKTATVSLSNVHQLFWSSDSVVRPPMEMDVDAACRGRTFGFRLIVLHLKAGTDYSDFAQRRATCRLLKEHIDSELAAGRDSDFVVAGDWNDKLDDPPEENVFQAFLDDSTDYRFLTLPLAGNSYHGSYIGGDLIDHLLATRGALGEYGNGSTTTLRLDDQMPEYEQRISDHRPVVSKFMLP